MHKDDLLQLQNVNGHLETKDELIVFVNKKLALSTIQRKIREKGPWTEKDLIPKTVKTGFLKKKKTDVIEIGDVKAQADRKKYRPLQPGCEISPKGTDWVGTAGLLVKIHKYDGLRGFRSIYLVEAYFSFLSILRRFGIKTLSVEAILTNAHVTQDSVVSPKDGVRITQPHRNETIGKSVYTIPFIPGKLQEYDVSLVEVKENTSPEIIRVGKITGFRNAKAGESVHKYGRTTGYTQGVLNAKGATIAVDYGKDGVFTFKDLDVFSRMSAGGDSGSVIVSKDDNKAVSLLFAGSNSVTLGIPFPKIAKKLQFEV